MVTIKADKAGSSSLGLLLGVIGAYVFAARDMGDPPAVLTFMEAGCDGEAFFHRFLDFFLADLNIDDGACPQPLH